MDRPIPPRLAAAATLLLAGAGTASVAIGNPGASLHAWVGALYWLGLWSIARSQARSRALYAHLDGQGVRR